jgi:hypothetical protein
LRLGEGGGLLGGHAKLLVLVLQLIELDEVDAAHSEIRRIGKKIGS